MDEEIKKNTISLMGNANICLFEENLGFIFNNSRNDWWERSPDIWRVTLDPSNNFPAFSPQFSDLTAPQERFRYFFSPISRVLFHKAIKRKIDFFVFTYYFNEYRSLMYLKLEKLKKVKALTKVLLCWSDTRKFLRRNREKNMLRPWLHK